MREADFIQRVFRDAAPIVLGGDRSATEKGTALGVYDVVTDSDVRTEEFVLSRIAGEFPDDSVISEETHPDAMEGERCWVLDPIDGTMNYSRGIPLFGMQAAFLEDGVPTMACIYLPVQDEMFVAFGDGAYLNGERIHTAEPRPLRQCLLATGDYSRRSEDYRIGQANLMSRCFDMVGRFKMFGASSVDYSYLSCGRVDIHFRFLNKKWDYLPGLFLATRAGAVFDRDLTKRHRLLMLCSSDEVLDETVDKLVPEILRVPGQRSSA